MNDDILRLKAFNGLYRQNLYVFTLWQDALFYGIYSEPCYYLKRHLFRHLVRHIYCLLLFSVKVTFVYFHQSVKFTLFSHFLEFTILPFLALSRTQFLL